MNNNNNEPKKQSGSDISREKVKMILTVILVVAAIVLLFVYLKNSSQDPAPHDTAPQDTEDSYSEKEFDISKVPAYSGKPYVSINSGKPFFTEADYTTKAFEEYSPLDELGRCGVAYANICRELMPTEPRGEIYTVKPSGWRHDEYEFVDGRSLYNRCHLIAHSLAGEDANERNLITGTRYMNKDGMIPFEEAVGDYVKETGNHVLYRVTPVFEGANLLATGVLIEAYSVEDRGEGICYCVFCYNLQPGVEIDLLNGRNREAQNKDSYYYSSDDVVDTYILNTRTKKFHLPGCKNVEEIRASDKKEYTGRRGDLIEQGYAPCKGCDP